MTQRTRNPFLHAKSGVGSYVFEDVLDACTPQELSTASWNLFLQRVLQNEAWAKCTSRVFFVCPQQVDSPEELIHGLPPGSPCARIFARKLSEGRVNRRGWGYLIGNVDHRAAFALPLILSRGTALYLDAPGFLAKVIPATGPSSKLNLLSTNAVTTCLGFEFEIEATENDHLGAAVYGFNPIPQFRRLFELRQEPPIPGVF